MQWAIPGFGRRSKRIAVVDLFRRMQDSATLYGRHGDTLIELGGYLRRSASNGNVAVFGRLHKSDAEAELRREPLVKIAQDYWQEFEFNMQTLLKGKPPDYVVAEVVQDNFGVGTAIPGSPLARNATSSSHK